MGEVTRHLLLKAAETGAARRIYVAVENVPSLRGGANAGFDLDHIRVTTSADDTTERWIRLTRALSRPDVGPAPRRRRPHPRDRSRRPQALHLGLARTLGAAHPLGRTPRPRGSSLHAGPSLDGAARTGQRIRRCEAARPAASPLHVHRRWEWRRARRSMLPTDRRSTSCGDGHCGRPYRARTPVRPFERNRVIGAGTYG